MELEHAAPPRAQILECKVAVADWTFDPNAGRNSVLPEDRFINAAKQHLRECLARAMRNLPPASAYEWYLCAHPRQDFGTCCAGTDSPVLAVNIVRLAAKDAFGATWVPEHKCTAEISKRKREFLFEVLTKGEDGNGSGARFPAVYGDCTTLGGGHRRISAPSKAEQSTLCNGSSWVPMPRRVVIVRSACQAPRVLQGGGV